jgi:hypothetical protein
MANVGCDGFGSTATTTNSYNGYGIYIDGANTEITAVNFYAQANNGGPCTPSATSCTPSTTIGIGVAATDIHTGAAMSGVTLDIDGVTLSNLGANGINIGNASNGDYTFSNLRIQNYNLFYNTTTASAFTGIFTGTGNTVCIPGRFQGNGLNSPAKTSGVTPTYGSCTY